MNIDDFGDNPGHVAIDFGKFVRDMVSAGDHWVFAVESTDWHFTLGRIEDEFFPEEDTSLKDFGTIISEDGSSTVCWLRRAKVPVEVVAVRFGLTVEQVRAARIIQLKPLPALPCTPTVGYSGEA